MNTVFSAEGLSYIYNFPYPGREDLGNSKGVLVDRFRNQGNYVFYAGDGASDLEAAERADVVFAHRTLANSAGKGKSPFRILMISRVCSRPWSFTPAKPIPIRLYNCAPFLSPQ